MKSSRTNWFLLWRTIFIVTVILLTLTACGLSMLFGTGVEPPPSSEFGLGPRTSDQGLYTAKIETEQPMRARKMQSLRLLIEDSSGKALKDAAIDVDGGMPQHGHGLPTLPRVISTAENGIYEIQGVRFSMGGWWELKLAIATPAGDDSITFNIDI